MTDPLCISFLLCFASDHHLRSHIFFPFIKCGLISLLLRYPEEVLIEGSKTFKNGRPPNIIWVVLSYLNSWINDLHYEESVVSLISQFRNLYILSFVCLLPFDANIVTYFNAVGKDKVILNVIPSVDLCDDLPHSRSSPRNGSLRVTISKIDENLVKYIVYFNDEIVFKLFDLDCISENSIFLNCSNGLPEDRLNIEHDIFWCILFGLWMLQFSLAHESESNRYDVTNSLD